MDSRLLLYIDEDYILPLSFDREGRCHEFAKDYENCLWLYFYSAEHSVDFSRAYRSQCVSEVYGYYGSFLKSQSDKSASAVVNGRDVPYFDLMKLSSMLKDIRTFYKDSTGDSSAVIPVSYVFAESIDAVVRRAFMENMRANDFAPVSFSTFPSSLVVDYAIKAVPRDWKFGDNIMIISSAADMFRLTTVVYDGSIWHADGGCKLINDVGDAPLKEAFIKYVVDEVDKNRSHLVTPEVRRREYLHQRQNADRWLALKRDSRGNFDIDDYAYYINPAIRYSCHVEGSFLVAAYEQAVRTTVGMIEAYRREVIGDNLALTVFCGPAFDDEELVKMIKDSLGNPTAVSVPSYQMPKALKCFWPDHMNELEDFSKFDSIVSRQIAVRKSITSWIASAAKIRLLWEKLAEYIPVLEYELKGDQFHCEEMVKLCHDRLKVSDFEGAKSKLLVYELPSERSRAAKFTVDALLNERSDLQQIFAAVNSIAGARQAIGEIDRYAEIALKLYEVIGTYTADIEAAKELITYYESHYEEYKELKKKFKSAKTILEARGLVERMSDITMEELPALKLRTVDVNLKAELKVVKEGLFGMKKKKSVVISASVKNEETLPCDAILNVSTEQQIEANEGDHRCLAFVIPKGESSFTEEIQLPDPHLDSKKMIYVNLFVAPKELDKRAINVETESGNNFVYVKQN